MHVYGVRRPNLINDPDVVTIHNIPSNVEESIPLAQKMALEKLGKPLDSYFEVIHTYYSDNNSVVFRFYKD